MILELYISEAMARKIQGLSVLSGKTPTQITKLLENNLETILNNEILMSIGLSPLTSASSTPVEANTVTTSTPIEDVIPEEDEDPAPASIDALLGPKDTDELSTMSMEDLDPEIGYQDPFMKSVQEEVLKGRVSEVSAAGGDFDEDEYSGTTATAPTKKYPMDYGIDKISENDAGATDFFSKIMMGDKPRTKMGNYSR